MMLRRDGGQSHDMERGGGQGHNMVSETPAVLRSKGTVMPIRRGHGDAAMVLCSEDRVILFWYHKETQE